MMNSALHDMELADNMQTLYKILLETHPDNEQIQKELGKLTNNKDTYLRQIIDLWDKRTQARYTEIEIKQICSTYYANETENAVVDSLQGREKCKMESRNWIVKTDSVWRGWNPEDSEYFEAPIKFEGEIKFDRYYEQLVVSDKDSGSVNLIWTIKKLIKRGSDSCLSNENWISLWLQFSRKYMPSSYTTLSRYSDNLETLFLTLVTNINADEELGKLRSTMARLHRKPGEQIQVALYKLKSYYELLLGISFPQLDSNTATIRADNYSANSAKYFVSSNTGAVINKYIGYKVQKGEAVNVMGVCQVISQHENTTTSDAIQSTMYLPEMATRLDTQMSSAKNVEELVIASSRIERGRGVSPKQNGQQNRRNSNFRSPGGTTYRSDTNRQYRSPGGTNYKTRGRSTGFRSPGGTNYKPRGRSAGGYSFRSPGGTNYRNNGRSSRSSSYRSPGGTNYRAGTNSSYRSPGGNTYRPTTGGSYRSPGGNTYRSSSGSSFRSPGGTTYRSTNQNNQRPPSAQRFQSPGGRRYQQSPGGSMWRKSPGPGNRGPTQQQHPQHCVRCGDPHESSRCPYYAYYNGPPCEDCNFLHPTEAHKKLRSGSGRRTNQQASSIVQQHQTEIVPTEVPNSNLVNYFETKNC